MLITRTPLRISLVGGGTDNEAFFKKHPGAVVSFSIDKHIYISVNNKFDGKFRISYSRTENVETIEEIDHDIVRECLRAHKIERGLEITSVSDIPGNGTGLGSSSAFTVGLIKALSRIISITALAERAYKIERISGLNEGKQDVYASAVGGLNLLTFTGESDHAYISSIHPGQKWVEEFENHCLLLWTGISRSSKELLTEQSMGFESGNNVQLGIQLARLANDFYAELLGGADMKRIGEFMSEGWQIKKMLAAGVSNPTIDNLYETAILHGAYGGKLLGAGGGGFIFFLAPPHYHNEIVNSTGLRKVPFKIEMKGSEVIYES